MHPIVFLSPDEKLATLASTVLANTHPDIYIATGLLHQGIEKAKHFITDGTEIIITRGETANQLRQTGFAITVVEIQITAFEVIDALKRAREYGKKLALVTFPSMIHELDLLKDLLNVDIKIYHLKNEAETPDTVDQAINEGVDVLIGGYITEKAARKRHFPFVLLESKLSGILQAADEARHIFQAKNLEKAKTNILKAVLNYAYDGIISVDAAGTVTFFNPAAEQIVHQPANQWLGKPIRDIWPSLQIDQLFLDRKSDLGKVLSINHVDVLCNKAVILVHSQPVGAVITFQDINQIQQMEAHVRHKIYSSGHIAKFHFSDIESTMAANSPLQQTLEIAKQFSLTHSNILLLGETGTGKEVFAQSIHNYSSCRQGPFVAVNCAALPGPILESELFGYVGGAFTGANSKGKQGLFEIAHNGTIFLDEIAEMDYTLQSKLLRVLQERQVMRLGSDKIIHINVRILAATNKNLKLLVAENKFRADLYYRLNVLQLKILPLRQRQSDIPLLAQFFLSQAASLIKNRLKISPSAIHELEKYRWPGNIRELENIIERVVAIHAHETINANSIRLMLANDDDFTIPEYNHPSLLPDEYKLIQDALAKTNGKYGPAAKLLGISRVTLWRKIKKYTHP